MTDDEYVFLCSCTHEASHAVVIVAMGFTLTRCFVVHPDDAGEQRGGALYQKPARWTNPLLWRRMTVSVAGDLGVSMFLPVEAWMRMEDSIPTPRTNDSRIKDGSDGREQDIITRYIAPNDAHEAIEIAKDVARKNLEFNEKRVREIAMELQTKLEIPVDHPALQSVVRYDPWDAILEGDGAHR